MKRQQQMIGLAYLRLLVAITKVALVVIFLLSITQAYAQGYGNGTISGPDIFGNRTVRYNNGLSGTLSGPDIFGAQTLRYNNGATVRYTAPDIFGNRQIQVQTMPRRYGW